LNYLINGEETTGYEPTAIKGTPVLSKSLTFDQTGYYNITYYSIDNAGNVEDQQSQNIGGEFEFNNDESPDNTTNVTVFGDLIIPSGNSSVTLKNGTVISKADGTNLNLNDLTIEENSNSLISGLSSEYSVVGNVLQWGIKNYGLNFDPAIELSIYVGLDYEGQTLSILRSISGSSDWSSEGLQQTTCVITNGLCVFNSTKASYYTTATYSAPTTTSSGGGGGGGSSSINCSTKWSCTEWTACSDSQQTRTCIKTNTFCSDATRPALTQSCTSTTETTDTTTEETPAITTRPGILGAVIGGGVVSWIIIAVVIALILLWIILSIARRKKSKSTKKK
jgi:hypothetical protein